MNEQTTDSEPRLPNRRFIEEPLLKLLVSLGGSPQFSLVGRYLELKLAEELDCQRWKETSRLQITTLKEIGNGGIICSLSETNW